MVNLGQYIIKILVILNHFPIDVRFIGEDYYGKEFTGKDLPHIRIHYNKRRHDFSTTNLRKKVNTPMMSDVVSHQVGLL